MLTGEEKGTSYELSDMTFSLGRVYTNDIVLEGSKVSRKHAKISYRAGGYVLTDLGAKNRPRVNGEPVTEKHLETDDEIKIGGFRMRFEVLEIEGVDSSGDPEDVDDGTQLVDMEGLLQGAGPDMALIDTGDGGTEVVPIEQLLDAPEPPPDWGRQRSKSKKKSRRKNVAPVSSGDAEPGTELLDMGSFLQPEQIDLNQLEQQNLGSDSGGADLDGEMRVRRDASDLGGTDLLNMDDVLVAGGAGLSQLRPIHYAMGGGLLLFAIFFVWNIKETFFSKKSFRTEEKLVVGRNKVLVVAVDQGADLMVSESRLLNVLDKDALGATWIAKSLDKRRNRYVFHILLEPRIRENTIITIDYKNENRWYILCKIAPKPRVRAEKTSKEETLKEVRRLFADATRKYEDRRSNLDNYRESYQNCRQAIDLLRTIPFGQFLEEYRKAKPFLEKVGDDLDRQFEKRHKLFAGEEKNPTEALRLLEEMCRLRRSDYEKRYLIKKTEYDLRRKSTKYKMYKQPVQRDSLGGEDMD
jgi:pSer/pThr/pTyr-binding forkhead associated (FHA) protein